MTSTTSGWDPVLQVVFHSTERDTDALTNVTQCSLILLDGLLLLPAVFATQIYLRRLAWLGAVEWGSAALATALLVFAPSLGPDPC